ncbi:MAG TPA: hypothetical protein VM598_01010, partial [Bdellovibrionota bacterium]|nr:hypothetical protein [Bdellovibrionota bacterium]
AQLQDEAGLHGVGRAFPFRDPSGQTWIVFHGATDVDGVDHSRVQPDTADFDRRRSLWLAPIRIFGVGKREVRAVIPPEAWRGR